MCVCRINKTKNYTVMSNYHLQDKRLSFKAKGLLSFMLSLPEDWDYTIRGLAHFSSDGVWCVKNTLNELKKFGYLIVTKLNPNKTDSGRFEYIYDIFEQSQNEFEQPEKKSKTKKAKSRKPSSQANKTRVGFSTLEKTTLVNSTIEKTRLENHAQQNTEQPTTKKQLSTEKEITEKKNLKEREKEKEKNSLSSDINSLGQILDLDIKKEASANHTDQKLYHYKDSTESIITELNSKVKSFSGTDKIFFEPDKNIEELVQKHLENGFTTQDFFDVINLKVQTWLGTKMAVQLKPSVIFSEKNFKNYVAEAKLLDLTNPEYNSLGQGKTQTIDSDYDLEERTKYFEELENRAQAEA